MAFPDPIEPAMCTPDLRLQILHGLPFFRQLSHEEVHVVDRAFREHGYVPGATVYHAGERASHFYVVAAGYIKLLRHTLSGQDVLLDILGPGDFFGALPGVGGANGDGLYADSAQAQTAACALTVSGADLREILQNYPGAALRLLEITAARLQQAQETIHQLSALNSEQRIAATLLKLAAKVGRERPEEGDVLIGMPLSRQDMADMTGATVETASRVLSSFRKGEVIRSGRQWIALRDVAALERLAEP